MKLFETKDVPLVGDGMYAILSLIANKIFSTEEKDELDDALYVRFIKQGFDVDRSKRVAKMLSEAINQKQGL